ncbi:hypothetical protein QRM37_003416 [Vibrio parahaemolyticus]|uniref:BRO-N domain-containing protein n=1 Tax=Vibrio parahaemolyticus TaxID=670 RepID=UPI0004102F49|nr:BRO family protein [Vibrio parahaemolyticus]AYF15481.1 hypothetical protein FORC72_1750 [Vibrio parahaemolyticus]AYF15590.1 hypothetical protein FORC72_1859 [Vibrio parahaemolyticus]ELA9866953.1 hypothetical protein [Vibrio parahaemolyticus]MBE3919501.1 hypothetical protein [Vibrio parahaemolyticus]MBE4190977.1 hypothetical protein [Vibrio parahaemolyticus]
MDDFFTLKYKQDHVIRSFCSNGIIYACLRDVLKTLSVENQKIKDGNSKSMLTLLQAQLKVLDRDKHKNFMLKHPETGEDHYEICVTEPGLYRVLSRDTSEAGKAFQRWIFHDVIPSIREHKQYPPPAKDNTPATSTNFASMDVTDTSLQMIAHLANGLIETRKEIANVRADAEQFKSETKARLENLEDKDKTYGLVCMDEFINDNPEIKVSRDRFLSACANYKFKTNGRHEIVSTPSKEDRHFFDIITLSMAKIS